MITLPARDAAFFVPNAIPHWDCLEIRSNKSNSWRIIVPSSAVLGKFKRGTLKSGSGEKVESRDQAIAIMMSEKRKELEHGGHYPEHSSRKKKNPQEK